MAKLLTEEANYSNIAGAIRKKLSTGTAYLPSEMPAAIEDIGSIVNGVVGQYLAHTESISPFTFVEFVENLSPSVLDESTSSAVGLSGAGTKAEFVAIAVDSTHVVLFAGLYAQSLSYVPITISGDSITLNHFGTASINYRFAQASVASGYRRLTASLLSGNRIFVAFSTETGAAAKICTFANDSLTMGSEIAVVSDYVPHFIESATINDEVFLFMETGGGSLYGSASICTVSGTTITKNTGRAIQWGTTLLGGSDTTNPIGSIIALDSSRVFLSFKGYAMVCSVSSTSITPGTAVNYSGGSNAGASKALLLSDGRVLVVYKKSTDACGVICTVSDTSITAGTSTVMGSASYSMNGLTAALMSEKDVVAFYYDGGDSSNYLYVVSGVVEGDSVAIVKQSSYLVTTPTWVSPLDSVVLGTNKVLLFSGDSNTTQGDYGLVALFAPYANSPAVITSRSKIEGVTDAIITPSTAGDIWVLNQGS